MTKLFGSEDADRRIILNLRNHPRKEIKDKSRLYTDEELAKLYYNFYFSEDAGNNDENFADWMV